MQLRPTWQSVKAWKHAEPGELRAPVPLSVLRGLIGLALATGADSLAALLALGFHFFIRCSQVSCSAFITGFETVLTALRIRKATTSKPRFTSISIHSKLTKPNPAPIGHSAPKKGRRFILSCCLVKFERV